MKYSYSKGLSAVILCGSLLFVSPASWASTGTDNGFIMIPLERMDSGLSRLLQQDLNLTLLSGLYDMNKQNKFNYFETEYYAVLSIGTPARSFKMAVDTTWAYSWVPSSDCPWTSMPCARHQKYDHTQSSSYVKDGTNFSISKLFTGYFSRDTIHVGSYNVTNQGFVELTSMPFHYTLYETDGTLGLGQRALAPLALPLVDNLAQQYRLPKIFSYFVDRDAKVSPHGALYLGAIDYKRNKTAFTSCDVVSPYYWQIKVDNVSIGRTESGENERQVVCAGGCSALVDTSSPLIVGPAQDIKVINNHIGATKIIFSNRYKVSCDVLQTGPNVTFTFSNKDFNIQPKDYIQKLSYLGIPLCMSVFQPSDVEEFPRNTWGLGGAFLHRYYLAFDIDHRQFMIADLRSAADQDSSRTE